MSSLSLADPSSPMPSSSSLIIDNEGQAHDPGYVGALRLIHAQIGARAEAGAVSAPPSVSNFSSSRRRPSSSGGANGGGLHAPARPSNLGLSAHGHEPHRSRSTLTTSTFSYSSSSDLDDDDSDDDDDFGIPASHYRHGSENNDLASAHDLSTRQAVRQGVLGTDAGPSSRHSSFSNGQVKTVESSPSMTPRHDLSAFGLFPETTSSPLPQGKGAHEGTDSRRSSWTNRGASHCRSTRSPARNPRKSTSHDDGNGLASSNWGFTGIVDVEKERERHRVNSSPDGSGIDLDVNSISHAPPTASELVAAASLSKSKDSGAIRTPPHGSIVKRASSSTLASNGDVPLAKGHHAASSASGKRSGSSWTKGSTSETTSPSLADRRKSSSIRERSRRSRRASSEQPQYLDVGDEAESTPSMAPFKQDRGLSTIVSGRPFAFEDAQLDELGRVQGTSNLLPDLYNPRISHEVDPDLADADFSVGPSKMKQAKDLFSKKSHSFGEEAHDSPNQIRRKMQSIALGARFKAFKVRKSLERRL